MQKLLFVAAASADDDWGPRVKHAAAILARGAMRAQEAKKVSNGRREILNSVEAKTPSTKEGR